MGDEINKGRLMGAKNCQAFSNSHVLAGSCKGENVDIFLGSEGKLDKMIAFWDQMESTSFHEEGEWNWDEDPVQSMGKLALSVNILKQGMRQFVSESTKLQMRKYGTDIARFLRAQGYNEALHGKFLPCLIDRIEPS